MAISEYTDSINDVIHTANKASIVINSNNKIVGSIIKETEMSITTTEKVVVGTLSEIESYIEDNNLTYETFE